MSLAIKDREVLQFGDLSISWYTNIVILRENRQTDCRIEESSNYLAKH